MTEFQQGLIEELILKPRTAQQLAWDLALDREDIVDALDELRIANEVCTKFNVAPGDAVCGVCGAEYDDIEIGAFCIAAVGGGEVMCGGFLVDVCLYVYCGGPISKALEAA
jgi:hypothetical protein